MTTKRETTESEWKRRQQALAAFSGTTVTTAQRKSFERRFPLTSVQEPFFSETLEKLSGKNAGERANAAGRLKKAALASPTYDMMLKIGDPRAMDYIVPALGSSDESVVQAAVVAAAQCAHWCYRDMRAYDRSVRLLASPKAAIRRWAAEAVGFLGLAKGIERVWPLLDDKDSSVGAAVVMVINILKTQNKIPQAAMRAIGKKVASGYNAGNSRHARVHKENALRLLNNASIK